MKVTGDGPIELAWANLRKRLEDDPALAAIARILNGVEMTKMHGKTIYPDVLHRDLFDALRLTRLAESTLNALYPEIVDAAIDDVAAVLCEADRAPFEVQRPEVQARYRRQAQAAVNAYVGHLEAR